MGEKQLWGIKGCKGHSGKFSLLKYFLGDKGLVGMLFPLIVGDICFKSAGLCTLPWKVGIKFKMLLRN